MFSLYCSFLQAKPESSGQKKWLCNVKETICPWHKYCREPIKTSDGNISTKCAQETNKHYVLRLAHDKKQNKEKTDRKEKKKICERVARFGLELILRHMSTFTFPKLTLSLFFSILSSWSLLQKNNCKICFSLVL